MFRTVPLPIIRSLFILHSAMVYVIQVCRQLSCRSCTKTVYKPVWHTRTSVPSVNWINSWWWAEELSETCRVSCRSKFGKLVHLVGFIIKKRHTRTSACHKLAVCCELSPLQFSIRWPTVSLPAGIPRPRKLFLFCARLHNNSLFYSYNINP